MPPERDPAGERRDTILTVMLCGMVVAGFLLFMVAFLGMGALIAMAVIAIVIWLGFLHYILWGRDLTNEVGPEREAEPQEEEPWWTNGPSDQIRKF